MKKYKLNVNDVTFSFSIQPDFSLFLITFINLLATLSTNLFKVSFRILFYFILFLRSIDIFLKVASPGRGVFSLEFPIGYRSSSNQNSVLAIVIILYRNLETTFLQWQLYKQEHCLAKKLSFCLSYFRYERQHLLTFYNVIFILYENNCL